MQRTKTFFMLASDGTWKRDGSIFGRYEARFLRSGP